MLVNLLEIVQQNLGYPALQKIDPNTQQVVVDEKKSVEERFSQAAIPAMLIGLYVYVQSDEGATDFLQTVDKADWVDKIFAGNTISIVQKISSYSERQDDALVNDMNKIGNEAVKIIRENLSVDASIKEVKVFMNDQKNTILHFLPAALNIGVLLHDSTLDDNTNKMEGPISSLIQSIGGAFSTPVIDDEIQNQ